MDTTNKRKRNCEKATYAEVSHELKLDIAVQNIDASNGKTVLIWRDFYCSKKNCLKEARCEK